MAKQRHVCTCALPPSLRTAGWAGGPAAPALARRLLPAFPTLPERFRSFTELKWGEFEAMGFGGLDPAENKLQFDLTESARTVRLDLGSVVVLMFTYRVAVASGKTNNAHLDGFLVHWIHSHRRPTERDPTVQHPPRELELILAGTTSRYHAQVEKHSEVSPTIWMGYRACDGRRGGH